MSSSRARSHLPSTTSTPSPPPARPAASCARRRSNVTDGTLNLEFLRGVQNPDVSAIEIIAAGSSSALAVSANGPEQRGCSRSSPFRAGGTGTVSQPPQFEVIVDGVSLGIRSVTNPLATFNVNNDANFQNYSFSFDGPAPNSVDIRYLNNGTSSGIDRNLYIDYITLNGTKLEAEVDGFFTTLNPASQATLGGARESLYVNGTLSFDDLPGASSRRSGRDPAGAARPEDERDLRTRDRRLGGAADHGRRRQHPRLELLGGLVPGREHRGQEDLRHLHRRARRALSRFGLRPRRRRWRQRHQALGDRLGREAPAPTSAGTGYFLPGPNPLPNTTGTGKASNGGFEGRDGQVQRRRQRRLPERREGRPSPATWTRTRSPA